MSEQSESRESQRRQATVIFADISGFTAMSEKLDPEEVTEVVNDCFAMVERIVHDLGGTIDKYIGDAVMALFGADRALENAPRRAVTAAIEIRAGLARLNQERRLPAPLAVHIGVHSGLVIAGEIGGEKKRRTEQYNERANARMFQLLPQLVNAKTVSESKERGCDSELPVFILGMPRSGTSLMEQILSSHPDIFGAGELKILPAVLDNIVIGGNRVRLNEPEPFFPAEEHASWEMRGQRYVDRLERLAPNPYKRIVDKMPGNFTMVGLIHAILPKARIIHSRRHPVEVCLSCYRIHFAEGQQWSYNLRELGRYYKRYWNLMNDWREQFPDAMLEVRYEDNVADVEGQARRLIDYLGLEWHDGCLEFYNTDRPVMTASASQVRKPIYTTSTNRWRKYEKYLQPLLEELGDIVPQYEAELAATRPAA